MVAELHRLFNAQRRFRFPFADVIKHIPENGIYVLFEEGEKFGELDRIVRVGTHTGNNQLLSRLNQHFLKENKNRSIFRKNIGRCFLSKEKHPYITLWELDTTSKIEREKHLARLNLDFEADLEKRISEYIQNNFSFCVFKVESKEKRLFWESRILSTLSWSLDSKPSEGWLGKHSPKEKIRISGLWQVNELYNQALTSSEIIELGNHVVENGNKKPNFLD